MWVVWKTPLTALCTAALVSLLTPVDAVPSSPWEVNVDHPILDILERSQFGRRDFSDILEVCPLDSNSRAGAMFLHFTAIFFQDFTTGGGTDILGPLAVGQTFTAPNYIVNANRGQDCSVNPSTGLEGIGLVVQGRTATYDTRVHGDALHAGGGDLSQIVELNSGDGCAVYDDIGTGAMDFSVAQNAAIGASLLLALSVPNMYMDANGAITDLGSSGSSYKIFTFDTCNNGGEYSSCNVGGVLSDPSAIFLGQGNFNGPTGDVPSNEDTVVFNIPVTEGDTIELSTNFPSKGFYACRTIYNFYPVNSQGVYSSGGEFTIFRNTGGQIEGFTLAPRAHIRDGTTGAFAGTIIGLDYAWYYGTTGVELHDYAAADDNCRTYAGCFPIATTPTAQYKTVTVTITPSPTPTTITRENVITTVSTVSIDQAHSVSSVPVTVVIPASTYTTAYTTTQTIVTSIPHPLTATSTYTSYLPTTLTETITTVSTQGTSQITLTETTTETTSIPTLFTSVYTTTPSYDVETITTTEILSSTVTLPERTETTYSLATVDVPASVSISNILTTMTIVQTSLLTSTLTPSPTTILSLLPQSSTAITPVFSNTASITTTTDIPRSTATTTIYQTTTTINQSTSIIYVDEEYQKWNGKESKWDHKYKNDKWDSYHDKDEEWDEGGKPKQWKKEKWNDNGKKDKNWKDSYNKKWDDKDGWDEGEGYYYEDADSEW